VKAAKKAFDLRGRVSEGSVSTLMTTSIRQTATSKKNAKIWNRRSVPILTIPARTRALALIYNLYLGQFEKAIELASACTRLEPSAPFGYAHAAGSYMALNHPEEARSTLQRAVAAKANNLFVHQPL
jgi:tetratricopeptide (TPR) repeat protein